MKSLDVLKAKVAINKLAIAQADAAHENYMGRITWKEYDEAIAKAKFEACCELENIIEKLEQEIEHLKEGRKKTHEEISIIDCGRRAES